METRPKILIVTRGAWDEGKGTSSTLSNLFADYGADRLATIYIESKSPKTKCCNLFFQIPEISMVKKLIHWRRKVGKRIDLREVTTSNIQEDQAEEHALNYVRGHRSIVYSWLRELLWFFNMWKTQDLKDFIHDFNPDMVWLDGSTNPFLDKLYFYVLKQAGKPGLIYLMDDNYTYKSMVGFRPIYHSYHRVTMRRIVKQCKNVLTISSKMKREFDNIFKINSTIVTKGIDYSTKVYTLPQTHKPIRLLYMGQIIYGRDYTLASVIEALDEINQNGEKIKLSVYTKNVIPIHLKNTVEKSNSVTFKDVVPYSMVPEVIAENDVLLFMESLNPKYNRDARLSFSTKITDYLASTKCIFAVGPEDCAPMEYFHDEDCAITAHNYDEIKQGLMDLTNDEVIRHYSLKAYNVGKTNHDMSTIRERLYRVIQETVN